MSLVWLKIWPALCVLWASIAYHLVWILVIYINICANAAYIFYVCWVYYVKYY